MFRFSALPKRWISVMPPYTRDADNWRAFGLYVLSESFGPPGLTAGSRSFTIEKTFSIN